MTVEQSYGTKPRTPKIFFATKLQNMSKMQSRVTTYTHARNRTLNKHYYIETVEVLQNKIGFSSNLVP
jgi:hypothetical protein